MDMDVLKDRRVFITGAASGLGRAAAVVFAREGAELLLADINHEGLLSAEEGVRKAGSTCDSYTLDVSDPEKVEETARRIEREHGRVDVLVNVAGVAVCADIADTTMEDWDWVIGVNLLGPAYTIRAFLPGMLANKSGHIVNVASLGGLIAHNMVPAYSTTKFGLVGLSEALQQEVREANIGVTAFCPGLVSTPILGHMLFRGYSQQKVETGVGKILDSRFLVMSPERTAELLVEAVKKNRPLVVTTVPGKFAYMIKRVSPRLMRAVMKKARELDTRTFKP